MSAAVNDRRNLHARVFAPDVERADAFGAVDFVRRNREEINAVPLNVHGNFADGLHGVHVKQDFLFLGDFADFLDGLENADFVVRLHDRDENRLGRDRATEIIEIDQTVGCDGKVGNLETGFFQALAGVEHGLVFGRLGDDVVALFADTLRRRPLIARLSDSVAPLVKTISRGLARIRRAICARAFSTASSAFQPNS